MADYGFDQFERRAGKCAGGSVDRREERTVRGLFRFGPCTSKLGLQSGIALPQESRVGSRFGARSVSAIVPQVAIHRGRATLAVVAGSGDDQSCDRSTAASFSRGLR